MTEPEEPSVPAVHDSYYFFGENYRTLFNYFHITDGAKLILLLDILKNVLETLFFRSYVGYFDAFVVLRLSWALLGYSGCLIGFIHKRYFYFWIYLALKITECATCLSSLMMILLLMLSGQMGNNMLIAIIKWLFPRVERGYALGFCLALFLIISIALVCNAIIFDIVFRCQLYFKRRIRYMHQFQRHLVTRQVII